MPAMARKRENANWASGIVMHVRSTMPTEFEKRMRELRLTKDTSAASDELRRWCTDEPESVLRAGIAAQNLGDFGRYRSFVKIPALGKEPAASGTRLAGRGNRTHG